MCVAPSVFVEARREWCPGRWRWRSEPEQLLGPLDVGLGQLCGARHATGHLRGLPLQVVAQPRLLATDLARAGHAKALGGTGVSLVLRHDVVSFYSLRVDLGVEVLGASALLLRRR